jgi:hypothetical protein
MTTSDTNTSVPAGSGWRFKLGICIFVSLLCCGY